MLGSLSVVALMALALFVPKVQAIPIADSRMIIEVNSTDGDAGIQFFIDAEGWSHLEIFDPTGTEITDFTATGSVGMQGLTELFSESAEPSFEDQSLEELFARFPEGRYAFRGLTVDGRSLTGTARFRHNIPAGPEITSPEEGEVVSGGPIVIDWEPVDEPFQGTTLPITVTRYQVIVERTSPKPLLSFSVTLPASATEVTVPREFLQANAHYALEVLAIEESGNQTISSLEFETASSGSGRAGKEDSDREGVGRLAARAAHHVAGLAISYSTPSEARVRLAIFDVSGRLVRELVDGRQPAGRHEVTWDRRDTHGRAVGSGVYFANVTAGGTSEKLKVVVAR